MVRNLLLVPSLLFFLSGCATVKELLPTSDHKAAEQTAETQAPSPAPEKRTQPVSSPAPTKAESVANEPGKTTGPTNNLPSKDQVRSVQQRLKASGFDPGPIDGILGPRTKSAIVKYQASHGLSNSGALDDKTLKSLGVE